MLDQLGLETGKKLNSIMGVYALFSFICTAIFGWFLKGIRGCENVRKVSYAHLNR